MAKKVVYFDPSWYNPSDPNDNGNGTLATPYRLQSQLTLANLTHDAVVMCKRGILYGTDSMLGIFIANGLLVSGSTIWLPYGDAEMAPTAYGGTFFKPGDAGWSHVENGIWKKTLANWSASSITAEFARLFIAAGPTGPALGKSLGTGYRIGTPISRAALKVTAATVTEREVLDELHHTNYCGGYRDWHLVSNIPSGTADLYVYTGSATQDPPSFYGGIVLTGAAQSALSAGCNFGIRTFNSKNQEFRDLETAHTACAVSFQAASADGVVCSNNLARGGAARGFSWYAISICGTSAVRTVANCNVANMMLDMCAVPTEQWGFGEKVSGVAWLNSKLDVATIGEYSSECGLDNVIARVAGGVHAVFQIGVQNSAKKDSTAGAVLNDCQAIGVGCDYGYAYVGSGIGSGNVARVNRFRASGIVKFIHATGKGRTLIADSVFRDATKPQPAYSTTAGDGTGGNPTGAEINWISGLGAFHNASYGACEPGCITAVRTTFLQPYGPMIEISDSGATMSAATLDFTDCLFVDTKWINHVPARRFGALLPRPGMSMNLSNDGQTAGLVKFTNSSYYTAVADGKIVAPSPVASNPLVTIAAYAGINGAPSATDPQIDASGRPVAGSPLLGLVATDGLTRDAAGVYRDVMSACGAYEYVAARPLRPLP